MSIPFGIGEGEDGAFFQFLGCGNGGKSITTIGGPIYIYF